MANFYASEAVVYSTTGCDAKRCRSRYNFYRAGKMQSPTYGDIAREVQRLGGFVPKTCWIAHVKSEFGLTGRVAQNRIDTKSRKYPCTPEKRPVIVEAMRRLGMI